MLLRTAPPAAAAAVGGGMSQRLRLQLLMAAAPAGRRLATQAGGGAAARDGVEAMVAAEKSTLGSAAPAAVAGEDKERGEGKEKEQMSTAGALAALSKVRLSALVVMTTSAGYLAAGATAAGGTAVDWSTLLLTCTGTSLAAAAANTFNQVYEREVDAKMRRTWMRPLARAHSPAGAAAPAPISPRGAIGWGTLCTLSSGAILYAGANPLTAALGLGNIALYAGPYTMMKRKTELNTWVGSLVGAIPPVMGWTAATGGELLAPEPALLASALFLWQFPHFFSLAWFNRKDYARGGFQMVPVNDPTGQRTADLVWRYSLYMYLFPLASALSGVTSSMFAVEGILINTYLLSLAHRFKQERTDGNARRVFRCSLWYLPLLLALFVYHSKHWRKNKKQKQEEKDQQFLAGLNLAAVDPSLVAEGTPKGSSSDAPTSEQDLVDRIRTYLSNICMHEALIKTQLEDADAHARNTHVRNDTSNGDRTQAGQEQDHCPIPLPAMLLRKNTAASPSSTQAGADLATAGLCPVVAGDMAARAAATTVEEPAVVEVAENTRSQ